jgi:hypothetical protein
MEHREIRLKLEKVVLSNEHWSSVQWEISRLAERSLMLHWCYLNFNYCLAQGGFKFGVPLNVFMTVQSTKASSMWWMQHPYGAPRLALKGYLGSQEGRLHGISCFRWQGTVLFLIRIYKCHCCRRARIKFAFNCGGLKKSAQKWTFLNRCAIQWFVTKCQSSGV